MYSAISMFCTAANGVRDSICSGINDFLQNVDARQCHERDAPTFADLPYLAIHEKHKFVLKGSRPGSVELIQCKGKPLQFLIQLQYPRKRWFSTLAKDWKQFVKEAESQFGPGHCIEMESKTCVHFHDQEFKLLLTRYDAKKQNFIEIKMAKGQFY